MAKTAPPTTAGRAGGRQAGIAYLAVLIVIAAMGAALAVTGSLWHEAQLREKERELLFVGIQYRRAIQRYYESSAGPSRYPQTLDMLLFDERSLAIRRYLRRPYRDPLTNAKEWGLVVAPQGGIMGVYSLAAGQPIRQANFPAELGWDNGLRTYADWKFIFLPGANPATAATPATPASPAASASPASPAPR